MIQEHIAGAVQIAGGIERIRSSIERGYTHGQIQFFGGGFGFKFWRDGDGPDRIPLDELVQGTSTAPIAKRLGDTLDTLYSLFDGGEEDHEVEVLRTVADAVSTLGGAVSEHVAERLAS